MKKLTEGNIWKTFILFAIPMVLSGLLSQAYTMIDTMIAGHYLGEEGLAAVGATSSLITFISNLFAGYLVGFGMYLARLFGEGNYEKIRRGVWMNFAVCAAGSILLSLLGLIFADPLMEILNVEQAIREDAKTYFMIYFGGLFLVNLNMGAVYSLAPLGDTAFAFYASLISSVINIGGNILTITVLDMGVAGIAWSSVVAAAVVFCLKICRFRSIFKTLLPNGSRLKWNLRETKEALPYTIPPILQQGAMYVGGVMLSPMINSFGSVAIASYVVSSQIMSLANVMYYNASRTISNYTAQCLGCPFEREEMKRRLQLGLQVGFVQCVGFALITLIPCLIFPEFMASIFFSEGSAAESISLTVFFQRVFLPFSLINIINNIFHGVFRAVKAKGWLISSTVFSSLVRIAASFPLTYYYGLNGFWAGMVIAWIAEALLLVVVYRKNWWMPRELRVG